MTTRPLPLSRPVKLGFIEPLLPTLASDAPAGDEWLHELKHDGFRTLLVAHNGMARAFTRRGNDWTDRYSQIVKAVAAKLRGRSAIIDGEVIVQNERGLADINALKVVLGGGQGRLLYYAFDLLHLEGADLRHDPLLERREKLQRLIGKSDRSALQFSEHVVGGGPDFFAVADGIGAEGIISKRATSRYRSGRSRDWLKVKAFTQSTMVVVGSESGHMGISALLAEERDGELSYVGKAVITMSGKERARRCPVLPGCGSGTDIGSGRPCASEFGT